MYRVYIAGLLYIYIPNMLSILCVSYVVGSMSYIMSFGFKFMQGSIVHYMFTYPVAAMIGVFVSRAVSEKPCRYPTLHILSVLPWMFAGFYGPIGYPGFLFPYLVTLLIARMYKWAVVSGLGMLLNGVMPLHSPLLSLSLPIVVLFVYGLFVDIYQDPPFDPEV